MNYETFLFIFGLAAFFASAAHFWDYTIGEEGYLSFIGKFFDGKKWAKPFGGCVVCFSFWGALIASALMLAPDYMTIAAVVLISHVTTRILSKAL